MSAPMHLKEERWEGLTNVTFFRFSWGVGEGKPKEWWVVVLVVDYGALDITSAVLYFVMTIVLVFQVSAFIAPTIMCFKYYINGRHTSDFTIFVV